MRVPAFFRASLADDPAELAARAPYPCVLKPLGLSASRGVIRADDPGEFVAAFRRIAKIGERELQVESYIPGREFAVEGLITGGKLQPIAIFDKPDPMEGPFFEETIYVTPSREPAAVQAALIETTAQAAAALGLRHGPVHAELRYNDEGAWILEVHARPIGGLCARAIRMADGIPLEEMILVHALGGNVWMAQVDGPASGVMMIPIPRQGRNLSRGGGSGARAGGGRHRGRDDHGDGGAAAGSAAGGVELPGVHLRAGGDCRRRWNLRCGGRTRNCDSTLRPRSKRSALRFRRDEIGRQLRALAEEVLVHLFEQEFLGLRGTEVEAVLVHEHLHVLHPHLPRFLGDVVVDLLPQGMAFERDFVQSFHLLLELHAEDFARARPDGVTDLVEIASTASTSHSFRILLRRYDCGEEGSSTIRDL